MWALGGWRKASVSDCLGGGGSVAWTTCILAIGTMMFVTLHSLSAYLDDADRN